MASRRGLRTAGLPPGQPVPRYAWRARSYPWAQRVLAAAEAEHGQPEPTCLCGAVVTYRDGRIVRCGACGRTPRDLADLAGKAGGA